MLRTGAPARLPDYHSSELITPDYVEAVDVEGIHGIVCVPVLGPDGVNALLYAAVRTTVTPGDIAVVRLEGLGRGGRHGAASPRRQGRAGRVGRAPAAAGDRGPAARLHFADAVLDGRAGHRRRGRDRPGVLARASPRSSRWPAQPERSCGPPWPSCAGSPTAGAWTWRWSPRPAPSPRPAASPVWWSHRGTPRGVAPEVTELVIDALREGLRNAVKHAGRRTGDGHASAGVLTR